MAIHQHTISADFLHDLRQVNPVIDAILNLEILIISVYPLVPLLPPKLGLVFASLPRGNFAISCLIWIEIRIFFYCYWWMSVF